MPTLNQDLQFLITDRAIILERIKDGMRQDVFAMLKDLERQLITDLDANNPLTARRTAFQQRRLQALLKQTRSSINAYTGKVQRVMVRNLKKVANTEAQYILNEVNAQVGVDIATVQLSAEQLKTIASDTIVQGAPSKAYWQKQARDLQLRFEREIRQGMLRGETVDQMVRRIRGTRAAGYTDGIMSISRREAEALVRTSTQTAANQARLSTYENNQDVINGVQWSATLDKRTTLICMSLHGKIWDYDTDGNLKPRGHDKEFPGPTAHWNCRSTQIPVVKSFKELSKDGAIRTGGRRTDYQTAFEKNLKTQGMAPEKIAQAKFNARASMDGQVARDMSFDAWLNSRTAGVQNQMLGKGRADLFRAGKISTNDLINQRGRPLRLSELTSQPSTPQIQRIANLTAPPLAPILPSGGGVGPGGAGNPPPPKEPRPAPAPGQIGGAPPVAQPAAPTPTGPAARFQNDYNLIDKSKWRKVIGPDVDGTRKTCWDTWEKSVPLNTKKQMNPLGNLSTFKHEGSLYRHWQKMMNIGVTNTAGSQAEAYIVKRHFLHELGHHFHFDTKFITNVKVNREFESLINTMRKRLKTDLQPMMADIKASGVRIDKMGKAIRKRYKIKRGTYPEGSEHFGDFMDILGSLTKGKTGFGHSNSYYAHANNPAMEIFAHMFNGVLDGNAYIEAVFPELLEFGRKLLL